MSQSEMFLDVHFRNSSLFLGSGILTVGIAGTVGTVESMGTVGTAGTVEIAGTVERK